MEWRRDDVEISPSHFSSAFYPPRDVEGLCQGLCTVEITNSFVDHHLGLFPELRTLSPRDVYT